MKLAALFFVASGLATLQLTMVRGATPLQSSPQNPPQNNTAVGAPVGFVSGQGPPPDSCSRMVQIGTTTNPNGTATPLSPEHTPKMVRECPRSGAEKNRRDSSSEAEKILAEMCVPCGGPGPGLDRNKTDKPPVDSFRDSCRITPSAPLNKTLQSNLDAVLLPSAQLPQTPPSAPPQSVKA